MTRIWTSGAESGTVLEADSAAAVAITTAVVRSGTYAFAITNTESGLVKNIPGTETELYVRYATAVNSAAAERSNFRIETSGGSILLDLRWNLSAAIKAYVGASLAATGSGTMPAANTWTVLQIYYKIADSGGRIVVKADGVTVIDYTGDTDPGSSSTIGLVRFPHSGGGQTQYVDDVAINTTAGSAPDNTYPVDGRVYALLPNADGDSSQWNGSDGNSTNNYLLIDERPPSMTDYVEENTVDDVDLYNLASVSPALASGDVITRVWATVYGQRNNATSNQNMQAGLKSGGTTDWDTNSMSLAVAAGLFTTKQWTTDPNGSAAWTESALNSLQVGIKVVT